MDEDFCEICNCSDCDGECIEAHVEPDGGEDSYLDSSWEDRFDLGD